ncbi:leucine-rich repeat-containing protein 56 homolog isoform X2 [Elgaria multicarinata webbii]|uniref:leucine-rich repeat-containing protein 56 homolog isoform X2 n=1 Tax=Elgaria multicarinata webbii TaxID=159646 RepID=UPI002FCD457D
MEEALTAAGASSTHSQQMNRQFVEDRIVEMDPLPLVWNVELSGPRYSLCVKMSRLKRLAFAFEFGSVNPRQSFPKTEFPERVIGTGVLPSLVVLDLSYNRLRETKELGNCPHLSILHMSYNQLRTLTDIPLLNNLTQLHLSSNKLQSLEGVQNLPQLSELYVQKNRLGSLLPLASSLSLNILDASSNDVGGLPKTLHVLRGLCRLKHLALKDNPVARDNRYITAIKETTAVEILDGMFLRDPSRLSALPLCMWPFLQESASNSTNVAQAKVDLEEVARRVFGERLQQKKENVGSAVHHFHSRILEMQEELIEYEEKLRLEMEGCIR